MDGVKRIYFAAGCFWGAQKYFDMLDGVLATFTGYANGNTASPVYREVYTDTTGFAETVLVEYDPLTIGLERLLELYFLAVDPLSVNRQGNDVGTRYRTGIFYTSEEDLPVILKAVAEECSRRGVGQLAVQVCPLRNFFPAEECHQNYLEKNPGGYCHLPLSLYEAVSGNDGKKKRSYKEVSGKIATLLEGEDDAVAKMAETAAALHCSLGFWWTGFYRVRGGELVLGPFQGPPACLRIPFGKGVCGTAWKENRTVVVPDVELFPGHIACSSASRSEIVVPLRKGSEVVAVLDIDSDSPSAFDSTDALCLERIAALISL